MWTLPILLLAVTILLSIPLSRYFAWINYPCAVTNASNSSLSRAFN